MPEPCVPVAMAPANVDCRTLERFLSAQGGSCSLRYVISSVRVMPPSALTLPCASMMPSALTLGGLKPSTRLNEDSEMRVPPEHSQHGVKL